MNLNNYFIGYDDENNRSLVLYLKTLKANFLFMGDAGIEIEKAIIEDKIELNVDYLKVGHHGSKSSTCNEFIEYIKPKEAIISVGKNNFYNHPSDEVVNILKKNKVKIRRTDLEGTITYKFSIF